MISFRGTTGCLMKAFAYLTSSAVLSLWLLLPSCAAAENVDEPTLERSKTVGDFYATDPTFHPDARAHRSKLAKVQNDWNSWSRLVTLSLVRLLNGAPMESFKGKELACKFTFCMTRDRRVKDAKIIEPSKDPVFDQAVLTQVFELEKSPGQFPKASKERIVRVTATYSSKPSVTDVDVTTLKGVLLNKKGSSK
ncbi:hypothetical protein KF913_08175 [Candidatus Obscuribacterales bacterium]|nr:hypothetical protein [Candidatus Obscuribacterales bacterium]